MYPILEYTALNKASGAIRISSTGTLTCVSAYTDDIRPHKRTSMCHYAWTAQYLVACRDLSCLWALSIFLLTLCLSWGCTINWCSKRLILWRKARTERHLFGNLFSVASAVWLSTITPRYCSSSDFAEILLSIQSYRFLASFSVLFLNMQNHYLSLLCVHFQSIGHSPGGSWPVLQWAPLAFSLCWDSGETESGVICVPQNYAAW